MMLKHFVITVCCTVPIILPFFLVYRRVEATTFVGIGNMEILINLQRELIEKINPYIADVPANKKGLIEKYISQCAKENSIALQNTVLFLSNPVNCFILIKRLTWDLKYVEDILVNFTDYQHKHFAPNENDFTTATESLLLLIYIYDINVHEFTNGGFTKNFRRNADMFKVVSIPMISSDCYVVALAALKHKEYEISLAWLTEALRKFDDDCEDSCPFNKSEIIENLWNVHHFLDELEDSVKKGSEQKEQRQDNRIKSNQVLKKEEDLLNYTDTRIIKLSTLHGEDNENNLLLGEWDYERRHLCYKEHIHRNRLHCQYRYGPHPFLRLARFKTELLHLDPEIVLFHDVISDEEIHVLKNMAEHKSGHTLAFEGSVYFNAKTFRHSFYVHDRLSRVAARISRRSLDISGLSSAMAESIKVLNYGPGAFHKPHTDFKGYELNNAHKQFNKYDQQLHDHRYRFIPAEATVLYYISEPDLGGATAFDVLNFSVFPLKKSALYWRTMTAFGEVDNQTSHASCPVLHGAKWGLIKWLSPSFLLQELTNDISSIVTPLKLRLLSYETLQRLKFVKAYTPRK